MRLAATELWLSASDTDLKDAISLMDPAGILALAGTLQMAEAEDPDVSRAGRARRRRPPIPATTRKIAMGLEIEGRTADESLDLLRRVYEKFDQAAQAQGPIALATPVTLWIGWGQGTDYVLADVLNGSFAFDPGTSQSSRIIRGTLTLECQPYLRGPAIITPWSAIQRGPGTVYVAGIPGDAPAACRLEVQDLSAGTDAINALRIGQRGLRRQYPGQFVPVIAAAPAAGVTALAVVDSLAGTVPSKQLLHGTDWADVATITPDSAALGTRGIFDVYARVRNATGLPGAPSDLAATYASTGGTLKPGSYVIRATSTNSMTESPACPPITVLIPANYIFDEDFEALDLSVPGAWSTPAIQNGSVAVSSSSPLAGSQSLLASIDNRTPNDFSDTFESGGASWTSSLVQNATLAISASSPIHGAASLHAATASGGATVLHSADFESGSIPGWLTNVGTTGAVSSTSPLDGTKSYRANAIAPAGSAATQGYLQSGAITVGGITTISTKLKIEAAAAASSSILVFGLIGTPGGGTYDCMAALQFGRTSWVLEAFTSGSFAHSVNVSLTTGSTYDVQIVYTEDAPIYRVELYLNGVQAAQIDLDGPLVPTSCTLVAGTLVLANATSGTATMTAVVDDVQVSSGAPGSTALVHAWRAQNIAPGTYGGTYYMAADLRLAATPSLPTGGILYVLSGGIDLVSEATGGGNIRAGAAIAFTPAGWVLAIHDSAGTVVTTPLTATPAAGTAARYELYVTEDSTYSTITARVIKDGGTAQTFSQTFATGTALMSTWIGVGILHVGPTGPAAQADLTIDNVQAGRLYFGAQAGIILTGDASRLQRVSGQVVFSAASIGATDIVLIASVGLDAYGTNLAAPYVGLGYEGGVGWVWVVQPTGGVARIVTPVHATIATGSTHTLEIWLDTGTGGSPIVRGYLDGTLDYAASVSALVGMTGYGSLTLALGLTDISTGPGGNLPTQGGAYGTVRYDSVYWNATDGGSDPYIGTVVPPTYSIAVTWTPPSDTVSERLYVRRNGAAERYHAAGTTGSYTIADLVTGWTLGTPPPPPADVSPSQIRLQAGVLGETHAWLPTEPVYPDQALSGQWTWLYLGTLPLPPMATPRGRAPAAWQLRVQGKPGGTNDFILAVDGVVLIPHDEDQVAADIPGLAGTTRFVWALEEREDGVLSAALTVAGSEVTGGALSASGDMSVAPGDTVLIVLPIGAGEVSSVKTLAWRARVIIQPRYKSVLGRQAWE